jgi:hypothetical protein
LMDAASPPWLSWDRASAGRLTVLLLRSTRTSEIVDELERKLSKIEAVLCKVKLLAPDPAGNKLLVDADTDRDLSSWDSWEEGSVKRKEYVNGKSASVQYWHENWKEVAHSSPMEGETLNMPGCGGALVVTVMEALAEKCVAVLMQVSVKVSAAPPGSELAAINKFDATSTDFRSE